MNAAELIQVDFKRGKVKSRRQLPNKEELAAPRWVALKDPDFKEFVKGIAATAEACELYGGDWRRMVIVMCDQMPNQDEFCMTVWDNGTIQSEGVIDVLSASLNKVTDALINEDEEGPDLA